MNREEILLQNRKTKDEYVEYQKQKLYRNTLLVAFVVYWLFVLYFQYFSRESTVYIGLIDKNISAFELLYTPIFISSIVFLFNHWMYFKNKWILILSIISSIAFFIGVIRILELWP